ncbi:MAG: pro-sigmaK processing inhibitor BofA [Clostridiales bacterium]|nr:pro-sigmaK processing inhibitor BofA [Clostridiales bacterium]
MPIDIGTVLAFALGLIALYAVGWLLLVPLKWLLRLVWNALLGGALLFALNLIGGHFGVTIALNPVTALTAGILGVPGVATMLIIQAIL